MTTKCKQCGKEVKGDCARCTQAYSREVKRHDVDLRELAPGLRNHDGKPIEKAIVVINSARRQEMALCAAHAHVESAGPTAPLAKAAFAADSDVLFNAKLIEALQAAFREPDDPKYPLFPTAGWMRENLTPAILGGLSAAYIECEKHDDGGADWAELDHDAINEIVATCVVHFGDPIPELTLARYDREWLTQAFVSAAMQWHRERQLTRRMRDAADRVVLAAQAGDAEALSFAAKNYQAEREMWAELVSPAYLVESVPAETPE